MARDPSRLLERLWRVVRLLLVAFAAALGPGAPPPPPPAPPPIELREARAQPLKKR